MPNIRLIARTTFSAIPTDVDLSIGCCRLLPNWIMGFGKQKAQEQRIEDSMGARVRRRRNLTAQEAVE
jgi:hypothetical protein